MPRALNPRFVAVQVRGLMRRFVLFLVVVLLPLQFAWGAVTAYCEHETGAASTHFGHHEHVHKAGQGKQADAKGGAQDNDCGTCHAAGLPVLLTTSAGALANFVGQAPDLVLVEHPTSPALERPERPQWARLA
jgi:hypothetical protein